MSKDIHNISTQTYFPTTCLDFGCQSKISSEFLNPKISRLMKFNALVNSTNLKILIVSVLLSINLIGYSQSLLFDGSSTHVTVPHQASVENIVNGDFTIEAWVNINTTGTFKTIVAKGGGNEASNTSYFFSISNNQKIAIYLSDGSNAIIRESNTTLSTNTWYHVAVAYDFNTRNVQFYLNGSPDGSHFNSFFSSSQADTQPLYIGRQGWDCGCNSFSGSLDEVRIWQVERTSAEIALSAQFPPEVTGLNGLRAYYNFDEGSGTTLNDNSLNNYHGTLVNSPTWNSTGYTTPNISPATSNWVEFDGATDYIEVPTYTDGSSGAATIEAWIRSDQATGSDQHIINFYNQGNRLVLNGTTLRFYNFGSNILSADFTPYFGEETHVAVSITTGSQKMYINGVQVDTHNASFSGFSGPVRIGSGNSITDFNGKMTDIRIWNDVRTGTEIQTNISSLLAGSEANLRAFYNMSEGSGTTLGDQTTNSFDGIFNEGSPNQAGLTQKSNFNGPRWTTDAAAVFPEFITISPNLFTEENRTGLVADIDARIGSSGSADVGITYSLSGVDASSFSINSSNGQVSLPMELDFDAPLDANTDNTYEIVVTATAGALVENKIFLVFVSNTDCTINNEAPGGAGSGSGYFSIAADFNLIQTFQPCATGDLQNIKLVANVVPTSGNIKIWPVTGFLGGLPLLGVLQGSVNLNSISWNNAGLTNFNTLTDIDLSSLGITLYEGQTYAIELESPDGRFGRGPNTYANGTIYHDSGSGTTSDISQDMVFLMDIIEAANTPPVFILPSPSFQFAEESTAAVTDMDARDEGTMFGADGTPIDDNVTYSLSGVDAALFDIDVNSGIITFLAPPDFENPADDGEDNVYNITVTANDGTLTTDQSITITVTNVFETVIFTTNPSTVLAENISSVVTLAVEGVNPAGTLTLSLSGGDDQSLFDLTGSDLSFLAAPDFEVPGDVGTDNTYEVQVTADDGFTTSDLLLSIEITDEDEAPVAILLSSNLIAENEATDQLIGTLSVVNPDAGDTHSFLIDGGTQNADFKISGDQLLANRSFDFEVTPSVDVAITARDIGGQELEQTFSIDINNVNEAPTSISLSSLSIDELEEVGTVVGMLSTDDQDVSDVHTYSLVAGFGDNAAFDISGADLTSAEVFDFETQSTYSIQVRVDDGNGEVFDQSFEITIVDVQEAAQTITFGLIDDLDFGAEPFELTATASSGLPVSFRSSDPTVATISGSTVTIVGAGVTTITASQDGDAAFAAAEDVSQFFTVNQASQTIDFPEIEDQVVGGGPIDLNATASSGLEVSYEVEGPVSIDGSTLTILTSGQVTITASQPGDDNYFAATDVTQIFDITDPAKTDQVITFNPPSVVYVNETPIILSATSDSGLEVEFEVTVGMELANVSGDNLNLVAAGTIEVTAKQDGNDEFNPATATASIEIKPVFTISGQVTNEDDANFSAGSAWLVASGETQGPVVELASDGTYSFSEVRGGTYYVAIRPTDDLAYYITAFGGAIVYQDATPIEVTSDLTDIDIKMVERPTENPLNGNGVVTGRVINDDGQGSRITNGRIMEGDPVEGASIFLIRKSDNEILTEVFSDANGDFEISGIPDGTYDILINIPGVSGTISQEVSVAEGEELLMTAMVGDEGIVFEVETVLGLDNAIEYSVYPNPFSDVLNVELKGESELVIRDVQGKLLLKKRFSNKTQINIGHLSHGLYLMELHQADKILRGKLSKRN